MTTSLREVLAGYLTLRRSPGYKLITDERLLGQFPDFLEDKGATVITTEHALSFATLPSGASPGWLAQRLGVVRLFAAFTTQDEVRQLCRARDYAEVADGSVASAWRGRWSGGAGSA
jgi:hypothetical protein